MKVKSLEYKPNKKQRVPSASVESYSFKHDCLLSEVTVPMPTDTSEM